MSTVQCLSMFIALGFALASCGVEDLKYSTGKDDPALGVTEADLEEVDRLLARQESIDRERGLRGSVAAPPASPEAPSERRESAEPSSAEPARLDLKVLTATKPEGWIAESTSSSMRAGQFLLPADADGAEDASLVVYYFGEDQGGTVEANLNRWFGQFAQPDGRPTSEVAEVENLKAGSMDVTWADFSGTMQAASTPGMPATESKKDWRMIVAIVESPRGLVFFRATGPIATIGLHRDRIRTFVTSAAPI